MVLVAFALVSSCGVQQFIPDGERIYTGAELQVRSDTIIKDIAPIKQELESLLRPEPNSKFLGMHLGLYYHYRWKKKQKGFISKWLNKRFGQEPVYFSEVNKERMTELMLNRLDNRGFFYSKVATQVDSTKNYVGLNYEVSLETPYTLAELSVDRDSLPIYDKIDAIMENSVLAVDDRFDLQVLKYERERIDSELKQIGYYNFNPDFLIFEADTNQYKSKKFDLFLRLKKEVPARALIPYTIDSVTVYPNYSIANDTAAAITKAERRNGLHYIQKDVFFRPEKLAPYILFNEGDLYHAETTRLTSNRLSALGSYKFVNIRFNEVDSTAVDSTGSLHADIFLSPLTKRAMRAELQAVTKSNGFAGPGISLTYTNRNLFKGGETFSVVGNFGYETQLAAGRNSGLSSISAGLKTELLIPRLVPFSPSRFKYAVPKTKIGLGGDVLKRSQLYTILSFNSSFGYTWNANRFVYHELNPISINYVNLAETSDTFDAILDSNPFLRRSFDQRFIAGLNYTFTYNELVDENKTRPFFVSSSLDIAGNTLGLFTGEGTTAFGLEYAQYAKADVDFRYYFKLGKERSLISRVYAGWGIPYGNSNTLPFVKQFFSGGPYSVRAFQIRSLGPGSFRPDDSDTTTFFDQSGNLRLEGNLEYRFPIWSYLKGAFFVDAGNVWLTNNITRDDDADTQGREFNEQLYEQGKFGADWAKQLGIGLGFGMRVDIQNFVIRLDLASPIQVPYLPDGERIRTPFFNDAQNNLILNFAIGYPF